MDLLSPAGFKNQDYHFKNLSKKSNAMTIEATEYCIAHPSLMCYFADVVEVSRFYPFIFMSD